MSRVLAFAGIVCIFITCFAVPSFAWGNMLPNGNASEAGVDSLSPLYSVEFIRQTASGSLIGSTYAPNNYMSLNNHSNYTPSFPQSQFSGVQSTYVDKNDSFSDSSYTLYDAYTVFHPEYYGEGLSGYLKITARNIFLMGDQISNILYDEYGTEYYKFLSYILTSHSTYHDMHSGVLANGYYEGAYVYLGDNDTYTYEPFLRSFTLDADDRVYEPLSGYYRNYIYKDVLERAPENIAFVYIDNIQVITSDIVPYAVGYGGTLTHYYDGELSDLDIETLFGLSDDAIKDLQKSVEDLRIQNDNLKDSNIALENSNSSLKDELNELNFVVNSQNTELKDLKDRNSELFSNIQNKNKELEEKRILIDEQNKEILELKQKNFELRNTSNAIDDFFTGMSSALWNGLSEISDIGYTFVDSNGVTQSVTIGSLITITVIGVVAFFVIKLLRGG